MGRIQIVLKDEVEIPFRKSFGFIKKGDISKKVESLIQNDLELVKKSEKIEQKLVKKFITSVDKLILNFYKYEEFSINAANKAAIEWDKIKQDFIL